MLIFVQIFFLALFEERLNKLLDQLSISRISGRISGIRPYRISGWISGRIPDIKKGRISGASLEDMLVLYRYC
jgi:hypothetical protein